jgi:hypothetical protein
LNNPRCLFIRRTQLARLDDEDEISEEPQWKLVEKVVALLEKALSPDAKVQHNVKLPVIGQPDREPRQCDVVITRGSHPRQTITIVEVQKRQSKPDINTFNGWVEKMREVGAQSLICVSVKGFPSSILSKVANQIGPTVRLMTLANLANPNMLGLVMMPFLVHRTGQFRIKSIGTVQIQLLAETLGSDRLEINTDDKLFTVGGAESPLSLNELVSQSLTTANISEAMLTRGEREPESYSAVLELMSTDSTEPDLWITVSGKRFKVRSLPVTLAIDTKSSRIPLEILGYSQETVDGELAWVAMASGEVDGKAIQSQIVFKAGADQNLYIASVHSVGFENCNLYLSPDQGLIEIIAGSGFEDS